MTDDHATAQEILEKYERLKAAHPRGCVCLWKTTCDGTGMRERAGEGCGYCRDAGLVVLKLLCEGCSKHPSS